MTYRGRHAARAATKSAERQKWVETIRESERVRARQELRAALERRPYRVPTSALLGFPSRLGPPDIVHWPSSDEYPEMTHYDDHGGVSRVTLLGERPRSLSVMVEIDTSVLRGIESMMLADPVTLHHHELQRCIFVARPWRVRIAENNHVHWWSWEPEKGGHFSAAVTLLKHLRYAQRCLADADKARSFGPGTDYMVLEMTARAMAALTTAIEGTSEWLGTEER
jgi:hypothetical protein